MQEAIAADEKIGEPAKLVTKQREESDDEVDDGENEFGARVGGDEERGDVGGVVAVVDETDKLQIVREGHDNLDLGLPAGVGEGGELLLELRVQLGQLAHIQIKTSR